MIATADGQQTVGLSDLKSTDFKREHCLMLASGTPDMEGQEIYETDVVQVFRQPGAVGPSYFAYVFFDPARGFVLRNAQDVPLAAAPYKRVWANFYAEPHWRRQFEHHARFIEDHWA